MSTPTRYFVLTEAEAMLPLVRRILQDMRTLRARLCRLDRVLANDEVDGERTPEWKQIQHDLARCAAEAKSLGIVITPGIRCEALFPFEHKWVGPRGDGKIRPAFFVFGDAEDKIAHWYFSGWPADRRRCPKSWRTIYRPGQAPAKRAKSSA